MKDFAVLRINFKGATESHSIEYKDTLREAETRYHNIITADIGNSQVDYSLAMIFNRGANKLEGEIHDYREEKTAFYPLIRIYEDETMHNSVQIFADDPENPGVAYRMAEKRWYAVIASDLDNEDVTYNAAILMDNNGSMGDFHKAFESPAPVPDVEPEEEPEESGEE